MAVDTGSITSVYTTLSNTALSRYDTQYSEDKLDAETYARLVGTLSADMMKLAVDTVQKQEVLDIDNQIKQKQLDKVDAEIAKIDSDRVVLERQAAKLENDIELATNEDTRRDALNIEEVATKQAQVAQLNRQSAKLENDVEMAINEDGRREALNDEDILVKKAQVIQSNRESAKLESDNVLVLEKVNSEKLSQQALVAKTEDEHGYRIDESQITEKTDEWLVHTQLIEKMKADANAAAFNSTLTANKAEEAKVNTNMMAAKAKSEYGVNPTIKGYTSGGAQVEPGDPTAVSWSISGLSEMNTLTPTGTNSVVEDAVPTTQHQAAMLKSRVEANVGVRTYQGYISDAYYKQYKSLQELLFALGNAGVEAGDDVDGTVGTGSSVYKRIALGIEGLMNEQTKVWSGADGTINLAD